MQTTWAAARASHLAQVVAGAAHTALLAQGVIKQAASDALLRVTANRDRAAQASAGGTSFDAAADVVTADAATLLKTTALGLTDGVTAGFLGALQGDQAAELLATQAQAAAQALQDSSRLETSGQLAVWGLATAAQQAQAPAVQPAADALLAATLAASDTAAALALATQASLDAGTAHDEAVAAAALTTTALTAPLQALTAARATSSSAQGDLDAATAARVSSLAELAAARLALAGLQADHLQASVVCKEQRFDEFDLALQAGVAARAAALETIAQLVDAEILAAPARGAQGWRCEKAMSNGTFRPPRSQAAGTCLEGLCCGAARVPVQGGVAVMTVETCQPELADAAAWSPPRAPMATTAPTGESYPWTCIQGAARLASGAAALSAALYALA